MSGHSFISNLKQKDENDLMISLQDQGQEALIKKFTQTTIGFNCGWKKKAIGGLTLNRGPRPITVSPGGSRIGSPPPTGTRSKPDIR